MKKRVSFLLAVVTMAIVASSAVAGEGAGVISVSPFAAGYTFEGTQHLETAPAIGLRLGYDLTKHWEVEAVSHFLETSGTISGKSRKAVSYGIDVLYNFLPDGPLVPYVAAGGGALTYGGHGVKIDGENTDATVNAGLGIKYFLTDAIALRGDARQVFAFESPNSPKYNWEYSTGVSFLFGNTAHVAAALPTARLSATTDTLKKGEPTTLIWTSQNASDCEIEPYIGAVKPQGSTSVMASIDMEYTLACKGPGGTASSTARVTASGAATGGHPNVAANPTLMLPDSAEKPAQKSEARCATYNVHFASGKAELPQQIHPQLEGIGNYLKDHPQVKVLIEGHTDNLGGIPYNLKLSERRAEEVKNYLVREFLLNTSRLEVKAYGSSKPVAENNLSDGRQMNRRAVIIPGCVE
jgi:OmpA-OmpF porin, OOP family